MSLLIAVALVLKICLVEKNSRRHPKLVCLEHFRFLLNTTMGYSNKRRRSKRRKTKFLNTMHTLANQSQHHVFSNLSSSSIDDDDSSHSNFHGTYTQQSYTANKTSASVPESILLFDSVSVNHGTPTVIYGLDTIPVEETWDDHSDVSDTMDLVEDSSSGDLDISDETSNESDDTIPLNSPFIPNQTTSTPHTTPIFPCPQESHAFHQMTLQEIGSYKIMTLLDSAGAPRICYNRLVALLKKLHKQGFTATKALNRDTLMNRLEKKCKFRPRIQSSIINHQEVFRFTFVDMLQDLLHGSSRYLHSILPNHSPSTPPAPGTEHELWNTSWMHDTFAMERYKNFNSTTDIMLPIILYMDKTGTDVNQRYSLEPVLFSLTAIPREQRESRHSWRHLGFLPPKHVSSEDDLSSSLQLYHDSLSYLLEGIKAAQLDPPIVKIKSSRGDFFQRRAMLPVMVVMGDQLSQDTLCGRLKSNSGGSGRVHRSCMCSYLNIDDPYHECQTVKLSTLQFLTKQAIVSDDDIDKLVCLDPPPTIQPKHARVLKSFLLKQRTMYRSILRHPFSMHPIKNAFDGIDFGSWSAGIHDASLDDFMHSVEAGMMTYIAETVYDGLTKREKEAVEQQTQSILNNQRCSVNSTFPRWRIQSGFTRQTLMTSGERVGSVLALCLSLHDPQVQNIIRTGHHRQIQKYCDFSNDSLPNPIPTPTPEFYLDQHMHQLDDQTIRHILEQMIRHEFPLSMLDDLDPFQINQMIWHCADIFRTTTYPSSYPLTDIDGLYSDVGKTIVIPSEIYSSVKYALQVQPSKLIQKHRLRRVEGTTTKHFKRKVQRKGDGSTTAVLCSNMGTLTIFLEYVLCFHAFCKYSWTLPLILQRNYENITAGNRFVIEYFQKLIYRGNNSIDSRFPKIHAQSRIGRHTEMLNTVMNFCCETGERLLKTEAKGISRTAQQRGETTFLTQTMSRIQDRSLLDCFGMYLEDKDSTETVIEHKCDRFARKHPHFICDPTTNEYYAVNRNNIQHQPDARSGKLSSVVIQALKYHEPDILLFEIYNEVVLRDNSRVRASPNYANTGPWYDYVNVSWETIANDNVQSYLLPAKCLCFFRKLNSETSRCEMLALVHTVDQQSLGKVTGRIDTVLTRNYKMQYDASGKPVTHVVPVASIDSSIRCFPHIPSNDLFNADKAGVTYLLPRNHWAYMWVAFNDVLIESERKYKGRVHRMKMPSLSGNTWIDSVRQQYHKHLNITKDPTRNS
jgi:hypothetical protein